MTGRIGPMCLVVAVLLGALSTGVTSASVAYLAKEKDSHLALCKNLQVSDFVLSIRNVSLSRAHNPFKVSVDSAEGHGHSQQGQNYHS